MQDGDIEPLVVEITDTGKSRLSHGKKLDVIVDTLFPRPVRFREVWKQEGGDKPLYIWRPVPPSSAYVAVGMIGTTSEEQPPLDMVRCLPRRWTKPAEVRMVVVVQFVMVKTSLQSRSHCPLYASNL